MNLRTVILNREFNNSIRHLYSRRGLLRIPSLTIRDFRHGIQRFIFCQRKTRLIRFLIRHSSLRFVVTNETRRCFIGDNTRENSTNWRRDTERERKREYWGEMFDKIAVTRILIFPCRLTIISSEIFAYLEISLMVILVIFICLFDAKRGEENGRGLLFYDICLITFKLFEWRWEKLDELWWNFFIR